MFAIDVRAILGRSILNHYTILLVAPWEAPRIMGSKLPTSKGLANETT